MSKIESFELELEDFCEYCGNFESDITTIDVSTMEELFEKTSKHRTYITCRHIEKCRRIKRLFKPADN